MTTTPSEYARTRRLHPASLLFSVGSAARGLLIPGLVVLFFGGGERSEFFLMLFFIPTALYSLVRYFTFRYQLSDDELVVRHGIVTKNERHVPYHRIQNIDLVQNPLHRLLRVATVRIETASGAEAEASLQVLSFDAVEEMRRRVFAHRSSEEPNEGSEEAESKPRVAAQLDPTVFRLTLSEVLLLGAISAKGMAIVGAIVGFSWQFDLWEKLDDDTLRNAEQWFRLPDLGLGQQVLLGAAASTFLLLTVQLFSVAWVLIRLYGFVLERRGEDLRTHSGLFTRVSGTIPRHRIQSLTIYETPPMRLFRRASVRVTTAGSRADSAAAASRQWVAPLIPRAMLTRLLAEVQPELDLGAIEWRSVHPRTARRLRRKWLIACSLLAIATWLWLPLWSLSGPLALLVLGWIGVGLDVRARAFASTENTVLYRRGWWIRRITAIRFEKIQTVELETSPFDRRWEMATVAIDTAGRGSTERIALPYLLPDVAGALHRQLVDRAADESFRW